MATPTFTLTNHQALSSADNNTGWNDLTTADTDIKVEGTGSMSGIFRADGEQGYYDAGSAPVTAVGKTVRGWILSNSIAYMGTEAADGYKLLAYDGSTTETKTIFGSDTYPGGWFNYVWSMDEFTTLTLANVQRWGVESGHAVNARNVTNTWMDVIRYLDGYSMTGGTSGDKITPADIAALDKVSAYNVFYVSPDAANVFFLTGSVQFGTGATTTYVEIDGDVLTFKDLPIASGLYDLSGVGSGTDILVTDALIQAAGTTAATRFTMDMSDTNLSSFQMTGTRLIRGSTMTFKSGQTVTGNTFDDCGQVTPGGADMRNSVVLNYEGTAGTAALVYDETVDPDGELDGMSFTKGTATTHAIELGTNTPISINLRDISFSGYNTANGNNDSVIYNNSGKAITVNVIGGSGTVSYRNGAGASTTIVANPVTTEIKATTVGGTPIQSARCLVYADTGGDMEADVTVTITSSGTTASVSHTAHGMSNGDKVYITGANEGPYNGVFAISNVTTNAYDYTMAASTTSPATGTIKSSEVIIDEDTDASGIANDTRTFSSNQPILGRVRKGSGSPYYKTSRITGTVNSANGYTATILLILDE